jgi:hypothetical protein
MKPHEWQVYSWNVRLILVGELICRVPSKSCEHLGTTAAAGKQVKESVIEQLG